MFINRLLRYIGGQIEVSIKGSNTERFINLINVSQIKIWNIRRVDITTIKFNIYRRNFKKLRYAVRKTGVKIHITKKQGIPFKTYGYRRRYGIVAGTVMFLGVLYFMSMFVWVIEVKGCETVSAAEILSDLKSKGFETGVFRPTLNVNEIENKYLTNNHKISWISINIRGTTATIEVKERVQAPEIIDKQTPCNIYAARDGVILSIIAYIGNSVVETGEAVRAGDLIVSGEIIDKNDTVRLVHSMAKVTAKTYRTYTVSKPLSFTESERTGRQTAKYTLNLIDFKLPLYFNKKITYNSYDTTDAEKRFTLFKNYAFPIRITKESFIETRTVTVTRTVEQALSEGYLEIEKYQRNLFGLTIDDKKITEVVDTDKVSLTAVFECTEDIAMPVVIAADRAEAAPEP